MKPTTIDEYLTAVPDEAARATLAGLRRTIKAHVPDAVEGMGYGVPGFKYLGRPLVYFGAAKKHCALYALPQDTHREELAAYDLDKGTIRFPPNAPPPEALVKALVSERMATIEADEAARKRKK